MSRLPSADIKSTHDCSDAHCGDRLGTLVAAKGHVNASDALPTQPAGQEPTYKVGNRTVAVYATVTGPDGRLVTDLTQDAFAIDDNGKRQDITLFANTIQPITAVVLLDRSGSMRANFQLVEQAAEKFVDALQPVDKARIGSFSNRIQLDPRDFTSDHGDLLTILKTELQPEGPTPLWNAIYVGITALLHQQGRRVVLVFTDGMDSPQTAPVNSLKTVMKYAEEEDVMVYAIGLASSGGGGGFGRGGGFPAPGRGRGRGGFGGRGPIGGLGRWMTNRMRVCRKSPRRPEAGTSS